MIIYLLLAIISTYSNTCNVATLQEFLQSAENSSCDTIVLTSNINISSDQHINMSNKTVLGNNYSFTMIEGARMYIYGSNLEFRDVRVIKQGVEVGSHFNILNGVNVSVINFSHNYGFNVLFINNISRVTIANIQNVFFNTHWFVIVRSNNILIENISMQYGGSVGVLAESQNITIRNSGFYKTNKYWGGGIELDNINKTLIENVTFIKSSIGVLELYNSRDVLIINSNFIDFRVRPISIFSSQVVIENSTIDKFLKRGIYIHGNSNVTLNNVLIRNFVKSGIYLSNQSGNVLLTLNNVSYNNYVKYKIYNCLSTECMEG